MAEKLDYKTIDAKTLRDFLDSKNLSVKRKKEFYAVCHPAKTKKVSSPVFDADGKPIMIQVKDKDGKPKFKKDGSPMLRQKKEMKPKQGGETTNPYSHIEAKQWAAEQFPEDFTNVPIKKEKVKKDPFDDWA